MWGSRLKAEFGSENAEGGRRNAEVGSWNAEANGEDYGYWLIELTGLIKG